MDYHDIYAHHADRYHALVSAEDHDGNLARALAAVTPIAGRRFVEVGAGTGRVTRLLAAAGARVVATEPSPAMLAIARRVTAPSPGAPPRGRVSLCRADARALPLRDGWADAAVAGWVFGHLRHWMSDWRTHISRAVAELSRVVAPGGRVIIIETLGTGATDPAPPSADLAEYYAWLEVERGFARTWARTDYEFESADRAVELVTFFFGDDLGARVREQGLRRVPECTGVWSRQV